MCGPDVLKPKEKLRPNPDTYMEAINGPSSISAQHQLYVLHNPQDTKGPATPYKALTTVRWLCNYCRDDSKQTSLGTEIH